MFVRGPRVSNLSTPDPLPRGFARFCLAERAVRHGISLPLAYREALVRGESEALCRRGDSPMALVARERNQSQVGSSAVERRELHGIHLPRTWVNKGSSRLQRLAMTLTHVASL